MLNLNNHTMQQPTEPTVPPVTEVENQGSGTSFRVWEIIKIDSWDLEMCSIFCFPALVIVLFIKDPSLAAKFLWTMIICLVASNGRQVLQLLYDLGNAWLLSRQLASVLEGRTFVFPFSLLAFVTTAYIEDVIWMERFLWAIMNLVVIHFIVRVYFEPIERGLELVLDDFLLQLLSWYMPTTAMPMSTAEVQNQSSRTTFGVLRVPLFYLAFPFMEYYSDDLKDRHKWAMILVFTFYPAKQAFPLVHELLNAMRLSQRCASTDNQSFETNSRISKVVRRWTREHFVNRGLLALRVLDMPFTLLAFVIMALMENSNWKDRYLGAIMSILWVSTMFQLVHLFLAILAILHYLKQRGSQSTSISSDLPNLTLTESIITQEGSSPNLPKMALTRSPATLKESMAILNASPFNLPSTSSMGSMTTQTLMGSMTTQTSMGSMTTQTISLSSIPCEDKGGH